MIDCIPRLLTKINKDTMFKKLQKQKKTRREITHRFSISQTQMISINNDTRHIHETDNPLLSLLNNE